MSVKRINEIVGATTTPYRKGEAVVIEKLAGVRVMHMSSHSKTPMIAGEGERIIDMHFINVGVDMVKARGLQPVLLKALSEFPNPNLLEGGPSYIAMGGILGDQGMALRLFALGAALDIWNVVIPATIGFSGHLADEYAGRGFIMCTGWRA